MQDFVLLRDKKDHVYLRKWIENDGESDFYVLFGIDAKQSLALDQGTMSVQEALDRSSTGVFYVISVSQTTGSMRMEPVEKEDIEGLI